MINHSRRAKALSILASTGMVRSNYEPPYLRALWRCGFDVPPPHFMPFMQIAFMAAAYFGFAFAAVMWGFVWSRQGLPDVSVDILVGGASLFFGVAMAAYYAACRRKYGLPDWESL